MIFKKDIEKLIEIRKISNLKNHFFDTLDYSFRLNGEIRENEILLWRMTRHIRSSHPIIKVIFNSNHAFTHFTVEDNPCFLFLKKMKFAFLAILLLIIFLNFELHTFFFGSFALLVLFFLFDYVMNYSKKFETKLLISEFEEQLMRISARNSSNIIVKVKAIKNIKREKEWTISKILLRVILYPFSIFIIFMSYELGVNGKFFHGFFGILAGLTFISIDLIFIFKLENNKYIKRIIEVLR